MGRARRIGEAQRAAILAERTRGIVLREIAHQLNISEHAVCNALAYFKKYGTINVVKRNRRPRKTSVYVDRMIHRLSEANRFMTATDIWKELKENPGFYVTPRTA